MDHASKGTRPWAIVASIGGAIVAGAAILYPWLALSVDILARDEVAVTATELGWDEVTGGIVLPIAGAIAALAASLILVRPTSRRAAAVVVLSMAVAMGTLAYVYLAREDVFTTAAVDATVTEELPAEAVERVVDLALRSGSVDVEPQTGLIAASAGTVVALAGGIVLLRMKRPVGSSPAASYSSSIASPDAVALDPVSRGDEVAEGSTSREMATDVPHSAQLPDRPEDEKPPTLGGSWPG